jgi:hypothetical protein
MDTFYRLFACGALTVLVHKVPGIHKVPLFCGVGVLALEEGEFRHGTLIALTARFVTRFLPAGADTTSEDVLSFSGANAYRGAAFQRDSQYRNTLCQESPNRRKQMDEGAGKTSVRGARATAVCSVERPANTAHKYTRAHTHTEKKYMHAQSAPNTQIFTRT